eukprot:11865430-Karenia_brevis.AAC.1
MEGINIQPGDLQKLFHSLHGIMTAAQATDPAQAISQLQGHMQEIQPLLSHTFAHFNPAASQTQPSQQHQQPPTRPASASTSDGSMPTELQAQGVVRKEPPISPEVTAPASKIQKP